jgi:hypothetical protein
MRGIWAVDDPSISSIFSLPTGGRLIARFATWRTDPKQYAPSADRDARPVFVSESSFSPLEGRGIMGNHDEVVERKTSVLTCGDCGKQMYAERWRASPGALLELRFVCDNPACPRVTGEPELRLEI